MGQLVCSNASLMCSFGLSSGSLMVLPTNCVIGATPYAVITDNKPFLNIVPFGMCQSLLNPAVAAATSAALGVLTPQPCTPVPAGPWLPGSPTVHIASTPVVTQTSKLMCSYGGIIQITMPGQMTVQAP